MPKDIFMANYGPYIETMINEGKCLIVVACLAEDPAVILGYSMISRDCQAVIWVYVKQRWRKKGIGAHLVPTNPVAVTHLSRLGKELLPKLNGAVFNPFYKL
jgi:GNAT superfamily N-acetyltransferase